MSASDFHLLHARKAAVTLPGVKADPVRFAHHLRTRAQTEEALEALNVEDLWLAWASLEGDTVALEELDRRLVRCARAVSTGQAPHERAELEQMIRDRVLVGDHATGARLAKYTGRGALAAWLKVVASSISIDARRRQRVRPGADANDDGLLETASAETGPETKLLDAQHQKHFSTAFQAALSSLDAQQRTMLRMRFVDGLDIEEVGKCFAVHRTTAMRWLEKAQEQLRAATREQLAERLKLTGRGLDSMMRTFKPSLHDRISRVLSADVKRDSKRK